MQFRIKIFKSKTNCTSNLEQASHRILVIKHHSKITKKYSDSSLISIYKHNATSGLISLLTYANNLLKMTTNFYTSIVE